MIASSSLAFPGSKTLAAWWRQLAPFRPAAIWVGHLFVHRLEALAEVVHVEAVDSLHHLLLRTLALREPAAVSSLLPFGSDVLGRLLNDLRAEGLVEGAAHAVSDKPLAACAAPLSFSLTALGQAALEKGQYPKLLWQRREFVFGEQLLPDGQRLQPPHFVPLTGGSGAAWQPDEGTRFDLAWLRQCPAQPGAWKERFGFPGDVQSIADPAANEAHGSPPAWQRVSVDRPERLLIALIAVGPGPQGERLLAFSARQEGWELRGDRLIMDLPGPARLDLPALCPATDAAPWTRIWQAWCRTRNLPAAEVQECVLKPNGYRLTIHVPDSLHRRLATAKSDLLTGNSWLLSDEGYIRSAVQVQVGP